jgi:sugar phosphate isomerase/epimerase
MTQPAPSIQLWSIREAFTEDMNAALGRLSEIGFTQVEPFAHGDLKAGSFIDDLSAALKANNLVAPTVHMQVIGKDPVQYFEAAQKLGVNYLIDPMYAPDWMDPIGIPPLWENRDEVLKIADQLNNLSERAKDYGIKVGYHNHAFELSARIGDDIALQFLIDHLSDDVVIELDTFWCEAGGVSAPDFLKKNGSRVIALHIKDGYRSGKVEEQVPAGRGEMPIPEILAAAPHAIPVIEFDKYAGGEIFAGVEESLSYLTSVRN